MDVPGLDLPALRTWLGPYVGRLESPLQARLLTGGKSNLTYVCPTDRVAGCCGDRRSVR